MNKTVRQESFKNDLTLAIVFILGAALVAWLLFVSGPRENLDKQKAKLTSLEKSIADNKLNVVANGITIKAAKAANKPANEAYVRNQASVASQSSGASISITPGSEDTIIININGTSQQVLKFLQTMVGAVSFSEDGQINNKRSSAFIKTQRITLGSQGTTLEVKIK